MLRRRGLDHVANRGVGRARADHEQCAWLVARPDRDVRGAGRAMEVIPRPQPMLFAFDDRDAFAGENQEALLVALRVVVAGLFAGPENVYADPEQGRRRGRRFTFSGPAKSPATT